MSSPVIAPDASNDDLEHLSVVRVQIIVKRHHSFSISLPDSPVEFRPRPLEPVFVCPAPRSAEVVEVPQQKVGKVGSRPDVGGQ